MSNIRFSAIPTIIAILMGALIGWAYYELGNKLSNLTLLSITTGVMGAALLAGIFGVKTTSRVTASIRVVSGLFFALCFIVNTVFACFVFNIPLFVIINLFILMIWILIVHSIGSKDKIV